MCIRDSKYLDPVGYDEITRSLAAKEAEHEAFMERVQAQIEERLKDQHVPYLKVYGRMKHPYSICLLYTSRCV